MKRDVPLDQFVRAQVAGTGSNLSNPAVNLYTMMPQGQYDAKAVAQDVAQVFTGIRVQCAQCHNHPFDRWTQDDYLRLRQLLHRRQAQGGFGSARVLHLGRPQRAARQAPAGWAPVPAKFLGGDAPDVKGKDPRVALADWLTSKDNTLFRENLANRIWAQFFGRGIVDPVDDVRISNPPSNRELLQALGQAPRRLQLRRQETDPRYLHLAHLSAFRRPQRHQSRRRPPVLPRPPAPPARRRAARRHRRRHRPRPPASTRPRPDCAPCNSTKAIAAPNNYFLKTFGLCSRDSRQRLGNPPGADAGADAALVNGDTVEGKMNRSTVVAKS